ncbi:coiled-coil domain-containing protein [Microvirga alba]|uniref:Uncharacterized protein n=1 Tax=Microvirga alba TaxID=2791025 RepID=A0A931BNF0_9HYPH|nr:hypothetical protein [Microvirga alba]MBF9234466.1 hypothetical protein [Microvirga alba]
MVETIMIFALGFLAATLIALLIIPAINARAERLARRRAEALFPLSIEELTAEKDHLRAEFAVLQRRLERRAEQAQGVKYQSMEELGRRAVQIELLGETLAERDEKIAGLQADLEETRRRFAAATEELHLARISADGSNEALAALESARRVALDEVCVLLGDLEQTRSDLSQARSEVERTKEMLAGNGTAVTDLDERLTTALKELDIKRITISVLETRLMTQTARATDFERALAERHNELSEERKRLAELAEDLRAAQERSQSLERQVTDLEAERIGGHADEKAVADLDNQSNELRRRITEIADQIVRSGHPQAPEGSAATVK